MCTSLGQKHTHRRVRPRGRDGEQIARYKKFRRNFPGDFSRLGSLLWLLPPPPEGGSAQTLFISSLPSPFLSGIPLLLKKETAIRHGTNPNGNGRRERDTTEPRGRLSLSLGFRYPSEREKEGVARYGCIRFAISGRRSASLRTSQSVVLLFRLR